MIEKTLGVFIVGFLGFVFLCSALAQISEYLIFLIPIILLLFSPFVVSMIQGSRIKHLEKRFRATLLNPDKNGLYPVPTEQKYLDLRQPVIEIAQIYHERRQPSVPHSFTFAPRLTSNAQTSEGTENSTVLPQTILPAYRDLPFKPNHILIGYKETEPKFIERETLISTLVGGSTNTGKSTLMRLILSQYLLQDCKISIIDPHYNAGKDSLGKGFDFSKSLFSPTAYEREDIEATIKLFDGEIDRRLKGSGDVTPIILVVDEFTGLLSNSVIHDQLTKLILKISSQSRKVFIYTFCISQQFHKDLVPSTIRNGFTHFISTKSRFETAQMLSGSKQFAKEVESINGYQCVYQSLFSEPERLNVPNTTQNDVIEYLSLSTRVNSGNVSGNVSGNAVSDLIVAHIKLGDGINKIVREVFGVTNKGPKYKEATEEIYRVLGDRIK